MIKISSGLNRFEASGTNDKLKFVWAVFQRQKKQLKEDTRWQIAHKFRFYRSEDNCFLIRRQKHRRSHHRIPQFDLNFSYFSLQPRAREWTKTDMAMGQSRAKNKIVKSKTGIGRMMQLKVTAGLFPMIAFIRGFVVCLIFYSFVVQQTMTILSSTRSEREGSLASKKCNL